MSTQHRCNICGKEMAWFDRNQPFTQIQGIIGYGSGHDGEWMDLDICCHCFDEKLLPYIRSIAVIDPVRATETWPA